MGRIVESVDVPDDLLRGATTSVKSLPTEARMVSRTKMSSGLATAITGIPDSHLMATTWRRRAIASGRTSAVLISTVWASRSTNSRSRSRARTCMASTSLMASSSAFIGTFAVNIESAPCSVIASPQGVTVPPRWRLSGPRTNVPIAPGATVRGLWSISAALHPATSRPPAQGPIPGSSTDHDYSIYLLNHHDGVALSGIRNGVGDRAAGGFVPQCGRLPDTSRTLGLQTPVILSNLSTPAGMVGKCAPRLMGGPTGSLQDLPGGHFDSIPPGRSGYRRGLRPPCVGQARFLDDHSLLPVGRHHHHDSPHRCRRTAITAVGGGLGNSHCRPSSRDHCRRRQPLVSAHRRSSRDTRRNRRLQCVATNGSGVRLSGGFRP